MASNFKPKKKEVFLDSFKKYKKHKEFRKPRSPLTILFCTEDLPDEWLIDIVEYKTKTKLVTNNYMITAKQVKTFEDLYKGKGFVEDMITLT